MFSIFTYVMSRVTHSEPGLPMIAFALKGNHLNAWTIENLSALVLYKLFEEKTWKMEQLAAEKEQTILSTLTRPIVEVNHSR